MVRTEISLLLKLNIHIKLSHLYFSSLCGVLECSVDVSLSTHVFTPPFLSLCFPYTLLPPPFFSHIKSLVIGGDTDLYSVC